jgi:hypothetical protein
MSRMTAPAEADIPVASLQGPWTRIRPLQIDDVDAKTAAAIKTGELTRGGFPNNLVKVMAR